MELWPTYYISLIFVLLMIALWYLETFTDTVLGRGLRFASRSLRAQHQSVLAVPLIWFGFLYTNLIILLLVWLDVPLPASIWWFAPMFVCMFGAVIAMFIPRFPVWMYADFHAAVRVKDRLEAGEAPYPPSRFKWFERRMGVFAEFAPEADWFTDEDVELYRRRRDERRARRKR